MLSVSRNMSIHSCATLQAEIGDLEESCAALRTVVRTFQRNRCGPEDRLHILRQISKDPLASDCNENDIQYFVHPLHFTKQISGVFEVLYIAFLGVDPLRIQFVRNGKQLGRRINELLEKDDRLVSTYLEAVLQEVESCRTTFAHEYRAVYFQVRFLPAMVLRPAHRMVSPLQVNRRGWIKTLENCMLLLVELVFSQDGRERDTKQIRKDVMNAMHQVTFADMREEALGVGCSYRQVLRERTRTHVVIPDILREFLNKLGKGDHAHFEQNLADRREVMEIVKKVQACCEPYRNLQPTVEDDMVVAAHLDGHDLADVWTPNLDDWEDGLYVVNKRLKMSSIHGETDNMSMNIQVRSVPALTVASVRRRLSPHVASCVQDYRDGACRFLETYNSEMTVATGHERGASADDLPSSIRLWRKTNDYRRALKETGLLCAPAMPVNRLGRMKLVDAKASI